MLVGLTVGWGGLGWEVGETFFFLTKKKKKKNPTTKLNKKKKWSFIMDLTTNRSGVADGEEQSWPRGL